MNPGKKPAKNESEIAGSVEELCNAQKTSYVEEDNAEREAKAKARRNAQERANVLTRQQLQHEARQKRAQQILAEAEVATRAQAWREAKQEDNKRQASLKVENGVRETHKDKKDKQNREGNMAKEETGQLGKEAETQRRIDAEQYPTLGGPEVGPDGLPRTRKPRDDGKANSAESNKRSCHQPDRQEREEQLLNDRRQQADFEAACEASGSQFDQEANRMAKEEEARRQTKADEIIRQQEKERLAQLRSQIRAAQERNMKIRAAKAGTQRQAEEGRCKIECKADRDDYTHTNPFGVFEEEKEDEEEKEEKEPADRGDYTHTNPFGVFEEEEEKDEEAKEEKEPVLKNREDCIEDEEWDSSLWNKIVDIFRLNVYPLIQKLVVELGKKAREEVYYASKSDPPETFN